MSLTQSQITQISGDLDNLLASANELLANPKVKDEIKAQIQASTQSLQENFNNAITTAGGITFRNLQDEVRKVKFEILQEEYKQTLTKYSLVIGLVAAYITFLFIATKNKN